MSNTSSKAVPVSPVKCNQEERRVLFQELREELKEIEDMSDSDEDVAGNSLSSGDMWRREELECEDHEAAGA